MFTHIFQNVYVSMLQIWQMWPKTFLTLPANRRWPAIQASLCSLWGPGAIKHLLLPQSLSSHIHVSRQDQARPWFAYFGGRRLHKWTSEPLFTHWFWRSDQQAKLLKCHVCTSRHPQLISLFSDAYSRLGVQVWDHYWKCFNLAFF